MQEGIEIHNYYEEKEREGIEKLFYAIMHRQWKEVERYIKENNCNWESIKDEKFRDTSVTIQNCFDFNMDNLRHNQIIYKNLCDMLGEEFQKLECTYEFDTYDDNRFYKADGIRKSVYDVFWDGDQPVLNLKYYQKQTLAAKQVMKHKCSMVLDEVGTGKTVCGIYTIQQVIQERINAKRDAKGDDNLRILVICPYNKREDWHNDIWRQLGLKSTIIDQGQNGEALAKSAKKNERANIFISGNVGGEGDDSNYQLKKSFLTGWHLVIIDECHNCFGSYEYVKASRVLLLTATPIVTTVKSENEINTRDFNTYVERIEKIMGVSLSHKIDPIELRLSNENKIYTCYFKEDIFDNVKIERDIRFIECERAKERDEWFDKLKYEKNFFLAIYADQDDEILAQKMKDIFNNEYSVENNKKLDTLMAIITGVGEYGEYAKDSFIVFCENTSTVDLLYERLSAKSSDQLMIGKLHNKATEIKNVQANKSTMIQKLKRNIREGNRSILITTGKSGGTGINLGEFTGVIHYELPFTSNELEQRFGRVERADGLIEMEKKGERAVVCNKMIFLVNKNDNKNKPDFITNRMLYYAVNKIRVTSKYMPIRNTVLFHPEYMKRVVNDGYDFFKIMLKIIKEEIIQNDLKEYLTYKKEKEKVVEILEEAKVPGESIYEQIKQFLENTSGQEEDKIEKIKKFKEFIEKKNLLFNIRETFKVDNSENILEWCDTTLEEIVEYYLFLRKTLILWNMWNKNTKEAESCCDDNDVDKSSMTNKTEDNSDEADAEKSSNEQEDNFMDEAAVEKSSKKQEEKVKEILQEILKKSLDDEIEYIIKSLTIMRDKLEEAKGVIDSGSLQYSGLFFINKEGNVENIKFD